MSVGVVNYRQRQWERVVASEGGEYNECRLQFWRDEFHDSRLSTTESQTHDADLAWLQDSGAVHTIQQVTVNAPPCGGIVVF